MGTQVKFKRGTKASIDTKPIDNGALYIATDTSELIVDSGTERVVIGGTQDVPNITDTEIDTIFNTVFSN